eukprot:TRINITY_DN71440_c0_g1_i1.p2 TRINITY_DN71440_c0_g1~~TRINITY_DN71440_c0_g1_i1.p2  ORF type:complete len:125 (-),score=13.86 TRINITY_DN71440_c0_g1_i1:28-402(-)
MGGSRDSTWRLWNVLDKPCLPHLLHGYSDHMECLLSGFRWQIRRIWTARVWDVQGRQWASLSLFHDSGIVVVSVDEHWSRDVWGDVWGEWHAVSASMLLPRTPPSTSGVFALPHEADTILGAAK